MFDVVAGAYLGLVPGVSGLATMAKFNTTTVKLPQLLEVGRATFHALESAEFVIVVALAVLGFAAKLKKGHWALLGVAVAMLCIEAFFVVPALDARVAAYLAGQSPPPSQMHNVFIGLEGVKILALLALALARRVAAGQKV